MAAPATERIDAALQLVRAAGGRVTGARRAILTALVEHHDGHPTVEQIMSSVQGQAPDVAESTVYRFLDELERLGVVEPVRLGHGPTAYHFADRTDHHHLVCTECGAEVEVPSRVFDSLRAKVSRDYEFEIDPHHFTLTGRCRRCAN
jgi:Fur family ferric uptake transcriptional regulator